MFYLAQLWAHQCTVICMVLSALVMTKDILLRGWISDVYPRFHTVIGMKPGINTRNCNLGIASELVLSKFYLVRLLVTMSPIPHEKGLGYVMKSMIASKNHMILTAQSFDYVLRLRWFFTSWIHKPVTSDFLLVTVFLYHPFSVDILADFACRQSIDALISMIWKSPFRF